MMHKNPNQTQLNLVFLLAIGICFTLAAEYQYDRDVIVLNKDNFGDALSEHDNIMIYFYSPSCDNCQNVTPEFHNAAAKINKQMPFAQLDCGQHLRLCQAYGIKGYPTIKLFRHGDPTTFADKRTEQNFVNFAHQKAGFSQNVPNMRNLKADPKEFGPENIYFVFATENEENPALKEWKSTAAVYDDVRFLHTSNEDFIQNELKIKHNQAIILAPWIISYDRVFKDMPVTRANLQQFLDKYSYPNLSNYNVRAHHRIFEKNHPSLVLLTELKNPELEKINELYDILSRKNLLNVFFTIAHRDNGWNGMDRQLIEIFGALQDVPVLYGIDKFSRKYKFQGNLSNEEQVTKFIQDFNDLQLKPWYRSDDPPTIAGVGQVTQETQFVKNLQGNTFNQNVIDVDEDVIVHVLTTWCNQCKQLSPMLESLSKELGPQLKIQFTKIDVIYNEIPQMVIENFPTLLMFKQGEQDRPIKINFEQIELRAVRKFIQDNATNKRRDEL